MVSHGVLLLYVPHSPAPQIHLLNSCNFQSYGVYLSHYLASDYFPGASPLDFAFIGGLQFGIALFISPLCTISTRELGRVPVMVTGCILVAAGFIAASFASRIWQLYLTQGLMIGLGMGAIFIPSVQVLPQWFLKRRSLAGGIASAGSGFGGLAFSLGTKRNDRTDFSAMVIADHWHDMLRRQPQRYHAGQGPQPPRQTAATGFRCTSSQTIRLSLIAHLGFHKSHWIHGHPV